MTLLLLLVLWFAVSLPVAAITGRALALGRDQAGCQSGNASKTPDVLRFGSVPSASMVQTRN